LTLLRWVELTVTAHPEAIDAIANVFEAHGTGGVAIEQPIGSHIEGEEPPLPTGLPVIRAYLPLDSAEPEIVRHIERDLWHLQAFELSPVGAMTRREIDEEDWANAWKEHFYPLQVGNIVVKPTWREWQTLPGQIVVELDPGMAFGTGLHPTTQLMLRALQERVRAEMSILDLGTGSGILAIAAARLGARVTGLDVDRVAVEVACENVAANGLSDRVAVQVGSLGAVEGQRYDLVLANIIASVLADLAGSLAHSLAPDGELLASGIVENRAQQVRVAFEDAGMIVGSEEKEEDWLLMTARLKQ
jgi:ribosomal protein L11 methyltransferase